MKYRGISVLACMTLLTAAAIASTPGTALAGESCFETLLRGQGAYTEANCETGGAGNFVWANNTSEYTRLGPVEYCVRVRTGNASYYEDSSCTKSLAATSLYTKVAATPYILYGINWGLSRLLFRGGKQKIVTPAGEVVCGVELSASPPAERAQTLVVKATYSECKGPKESKVTVSTAELEINADGSLGVVHKAITLKLSGCAMTIPDNSGNSDLSGVTVANAGKGIEVEAHVEDLSYESIGCEGAKKGSNGDYGGSIEIEEEGETLLIELVP
jgi:hypothetical protein